ncbi:MAG: hypothetical protein U0324_15095 [Polyangiales bacterium]
MTRSILWAAAWLCGCATTTPPVVRATTLPTPPATVAEAPAEPPPPPSLAMQSYAAYRRALELAPERPDAYYHLAQLYRIEGGGDISALACAGSYYRAFLTRAGDDPRYRAQAASARQVLSTHAGPLPALRAMGPLPGGTGEAFAPPAPLSAARPRPLPDCAM